MPEPLGLISRTPFPAASRLAAQQAAYGEFVKTIPASVWQSDMLDEAELKKACDRVEAFLQLDSTSVPALEDALRLQLRQIRGCAMNLAALGEDDKAKRQSLLQKARQDCQSWGPYFASLGEFKDISVETRSQLGLWMATAGDIHCAMDLEPTAVDFYETGVDVTAPESDEHARCKRELGRTHAYLARDAAHKGVSDSRSICERAAKFELDGGGCYMLSQAYAILAEFDMAEQICRRGLALEPDLTDVESMERHEKQRQNLHGMLENISVLRTRHAASQLAKKAMDLLQAQQPDKALPLLDQAIKTDPNTAQLYVVRCQCRLILDMSEGADQDLQKFKSLADADDIEIISKLQHEINKKLATVRRVGKEATALLQKGAEAATREDFDSAQKHLRQAMNLALPGGKKDIADRLATVLTNWAVDSVNKTMEDSSASATVHQRALARAMEFLSEASQLAPSESHIKQRMAELRDLKGKVDQAVEFQSRADEYGGMEALEIRQEAVTAFNDGKHTKAVELLRKALKMSCNNPKLRQELSEILGATAISLVNDSGLTMQTMFEATAHLKEAVELDPSNESARKALAQLNGAVPNYMSKLRSPRF